MNCDGEDDEPQNNFI